MELVSKTVVDEGGLLVVRLRPAAVLEHNIVVPPTFNLHVGLCGLGVLLLEERVPGENVFHPDPLLLIASLHLLVRLKKKINILSKIFEYPSYYVSNIFQHSRLQNKFQHKWRKEILLLKLKLRHHIETTVLRKNFGRTKLCVKIIRHR